MTRIISVLRCCKRCDRERDQPYCEHCGVWTRTEAEEAASIEDRIYGVDTDPGYGNDRNDT